MRLRRLGLVLNVVGVAGLIVAALASDDRSPVLFTIEASVALAGGMTCLAIGGLRDNYRQRSRSAPARDPVRSSCEPG
jgi:hypothetical protein